MLSCYKRSLYTQAHAYKCVVGEFAGSAKGKGDIAEGTINKWLRKSS